MMLIRTSTLQMLAVALVLSVATAFMPHLTNQRINGGLAVWHDASLVGSRSSFPVASGSNKRSRVTGLQMGLADRFFRVVKANLNSVLQNLEDPEKILEQAVEDMQKDLIKIRQSYAEVSATQKRMERQKEQAGNLANEWYKRAQLALSKGDEELAREALSRRQQQVEVATALAEQMGVQTQAINKLFISMQQLEAKITEAKSKKVQWIARARTAKTSQKSKKDQMIARARTAKTSQKVNDMLSSMTGSTSMDAFDRMKDKVEMLESKAEVAGQMAGVDSNSIEGKFKLLGSQSQVEDELNKMKGLLTGTSSASSKKSVGYLPTGERDMDRELDVLREEMNNK